MNATLTDQGHNLRIAFSVDGHEVAINIDPGNVLETVEQHAAAVAHGLLDKVGGEFEKLRAEARTKINELLGVVFAMPDVSVTPNTTELGAGGVTWTGTWATTIEGAEIPKIGATTTAISTSGTVINPVTAEQALKHRHALAKTPKTSKPKPKATKPKEKK